MRLVRHLLVMGFAMILTFRQGRVALIWAAPSSISREWATPPVQPLSQEARRGSCRRMC